MNLFRVVYRKVFVDEGGRAVFPCVQGVLRFFNRLIRATT